MTPATCAECGRDEPAGGGVDMFICRCVADAADDGTEVTEEEADYELVIFTDVDSEGIEHKHCGDRDCPQRGICIDDWNNLYDDVAVASWWPEEVTPLPS